MYKGIAASNTCISTVDSNCVVYRTKDKDSGLKTECHRLTEVLDDIYLKISPDSSEELKELSERVTALEKRIDAIDKNTSEKESLCKASIEMCDLDYKGLVDECGTEVIPRNLEEVLQLIINTITPNG